MSNNFKAISLFLSEPFNELKFQKVFKKLYRVLENMDDSKYLPPRFSYAYKGLADFLGFSDLDDNLSSASEISLVSLASPEFAHPFPSFFAHSLKGYTQDTEDSGKLSSAKEESKSAACDNTGGASFSARRNKHKAQSRQTE